MTSRCRRAYARTLESCELLISLLTIQFCTFYPATVLLLSFTSHLPRTIFLEISSLQKSLMNNPISKTHSKEFFFYKFFGFQFGQPVSVCGVLRFGEDHLFAKHEGQVKPVGKVTVVDCTNPEDYPSCFPAGWMVLHETMYKMTCCS